jgi:Zn finger protein HypA/HybF involved in hydrogenase expression
MGLPELEVKCWTCWGNGVIPVEDHGQMMECPECSGVGWIPTEDGKRLLAFLQRHLAVDADEEEQ